MARRPRLHTERLRLLAIAIVLALAIGLYFVIQRGKLGDQRLATDKTLLMGLAATLVVFALALAWILVRNLARVLADRREGVLGARLRARVVLAFLLLVLIPAVFLFVGAVSIVSQTLRSVATPELEQTLRDAGSAAELVFSQARGRARHAVSELARQVDPALAARSPQIDDLLAEFCRRQAVTGAGLIRDGGPSPCAVLLELSPRQASEEELCAVPPALLNRALAEDVVVDIGESLPAFGWRALAARRLPEMRQVVVWVEVYLADSDAARLEGLSLTRDQIVGFRRTRPAMQRLYVALFSLLTLLVLFAAVWIGLFLTRQVTDPIEDLVRATEALAKGDLGARARAAGRDEMAHLARSFNRMADEIQHQRGTLLARQHYIETLLAAVPVGVISLDLDGRVETANRRALEVLRLARIEQGTVLTELLRGRLAALSAPVERLLERGLARIEREVVLRDGEEAVSVQLYGGRFRIAEKEQGVLLVLEDLTLLRRAERLAAWGEVARRVAHEIRNPLTPIRLAAERILRKHRSRAPDAAEVLEQGTQTIVREVESIKRLVDEFARFARLPEIRLEEGDLSQVAREGVQLYRASHPAVNIRTELAERLPRHRFDADGMRRCLINLLENAVAIIEEGGQVIVRTTADGESGRVRLEVEDDGPGLADDDREKLFLPTFSRREGGTGLGLAIVHRIVSEHGGAIRAESRSGRGTRIIIELPALESR